MKKIISLTFGNPKTQGGIESFNRILKEFYPNLIMITQTIKYVKIYDVPDVIEIGSRNLIFRIINKIFFNKIREYLIVNEIKKNKGEVLILSHPNEVEIVKKYKGKKILVQHLSYDYYLKIYCGNNIELKNKIRNFISYFVVLSPYDAIKFRKGFNLLEKQVKVIRHTCNMEIIQNKKEKNKKLIMIARIDNQQKRFDLAIRAMKKLKDFTLDIYGDIYNQEDMEFLQKVIEKENITNVNFKGPTNKVKEKLDDSGIFIMTSDFEGYPIALIEAMRRGLPIVLRNTFDSAQDIVINNGVLLEKEWNENKFVEGVKEIYKNYEYYSENSKKLGERHNPEVIKKEWDELLK